MLINALGLTFLTLGSTLPGENPVEADWLALDEDIEALAGSLQSNDGMLNLVGRLIGSYSYSDDAYFAVGGDDLSGFDLRSARVEVVGEVEDYSIKIGWELENGSGQLVDAYAVTDIGEITNLTVGRFKKPLLYSGDLDSRYRLFFDFGINGFQNNQRDLGAKLTTTIDNLQVILAVQNGADRDAEEQVFVARLLYDLIGDAFRAYEGSYDAPEGTSLGFGLAVYDDANIDNGTAVAFEGQLSQGSIYLQGDIVSYDDGYDSSTGLDPDQLLGTSKADTSPFSVTASYLFGADRNYEAAVRYEDFDDLSDTERFGLSFLRYHKMFGHDAKWLLNYQEFSSEDQALEGTRLEIGYVIGF